MTLAPGTLVHNRYRIVRQIGRGGMGAVYEAMDEHLSKAVALKQTLTSDSQLREAFELQAQVLARLEHEALPRVTDHFVEGNDQFMVMTLIPGENLGELLEKNGGPFAVDTVLGWADQVLNVLEYLHQQYPPVIHRDIKPQNIKLTTGGKIVLIDFDLAKGLVSLSQQGKLADSVPGFTLHYAPLEQFTSAGTEPRSDLYALSATAYHLLTDVPPAHIGDRVEALSDGKPDPLPPAHQINPQVPVAVGELLQRGLSLKISQRPGSASLMRADLMAAWRSMPSGGRGPQQAAAGAAQASTAYTGKTIAAGGSSTVPLPTPSPTGVPSPSPSPTAGPAAPKKRLSINKLGCGFLITLIFLSFVGSKIMTFDPYGGGRDNERGALAPMGTLAIVDPMDQTLVSQTLVAYGETKEAQTQTVAYETEMAGGPTMESKTPPPLNVPTIDPALQEHEGDVVALSTAIAEDDQNADAYRLRGDARREAGIYTLAKADYDTALELDPEHVEAFVGRGLLYLDQGEYALAVNDFNRALNRRPYSYRIYRYRADAHRQQGKNERAIEDYTRSIAFNSMDKLTYRNRGLAYSNMGLSEAAIADYTSAIERDPDYADAYNDRGVEYGNIGQYEQAIADYTRAIELVPDYTFAYNNRGTAYNDLGEYDRALDDYTKAIELDPDYAVAYRNRGLNYSDIGDYEQAIADYTQALEINPDYVDVYNDRGVEYGDIGDYEQAIADYTRAIELDPDFAYAYNNRGTAYNDLGEYGQALDDYTKAIELDPDYALSYRNRALNYSDMEAYDQAIADYTQALEINPDYATAYNGRGVVYDDIGEYDKAIDDYTRAIELDPNYLQAYNNRGVAYENKEMYSEAIADYTQAMEIDPEYALAYRNRGDVYTKQGEEQKAIADYERALELTDSESLRETVEKKLSELRGK